MTNIVLLAGNIGNDPETVTTGGGTKIAEFRLATSRPKRAGGKVVKDESGYTEQDTEWHRIKSFNGLAETVHKHCLKGMKVLVRGRIHYTKWTDNEGIERFSCEIIADVIDFLSSPIRGNAGNQAGNTEDIVF